MLGGRLGTTRISPKTGTRHQGRDSPNTGARPMSSGSLRTGLFLMVLMPSFWDVMDLWQIGNLGEHFYLRIFKLEFYYPYLLEEEETEVPVVKESSKEATKMADEVQPETAPPSSGETDLNMHDAKTDGPASENGAPESDKATQPEAPKKKVKKTNVPVSEIIYGGLASADLQKAVEKEFEMALQDRVMEETKDNKNVVEAVYYMRNKLYDQYQDFVTDSEREQFISKLQEVEDWLYEDEEDETKGVYVAKLEELKKTFLHGPQITTLSNLLLLQVEESSSLVRNATGQIYFSLFWVVWDILAPSQGQELS